MPDSNELLPSDPGWDYGDILPLARNRQTGQLSLAIPGFLRGAVNDLALAATVPGQVASGQMSLQQAAPLVPRMALGLAGMGGMGEAPEGALRIFAGRTAKTADTAALSRAMSMESQGHAPAAIWDSTGWMKGPDGNWRFEIPDAGAKLHLSPEGGKIDLQDYTQPYLGEIINHPELFKAYPELEKMSVFPAASEAYIGAFVPTTNSIELAAQNPEEFLSTALHEIQHGIQFREGFAAGGSSEDFLSPQFHNDHFAATNLFNNTRQKLTENGMNPNLVQKAITKNMIGVPLSDVEEKELRLAHFVEGNLPSKMETSLTWLAKLGEQRAAASDKYMNLAGEVEARNVQERHASGETGYPPSTAGYTPFEQQIVHFDPTTGSLSFKGFHGTPHTFEPVEGNPFGAFRDEAVGSGEGAQAYGWGHYVAGNKTVAEEYRDKLSRRMYPSQDVLQQYFKPGDIVNGYGGKDRVISFNPGEQGRWSVTVQAVDKNGAPLQGIDGRIRVHATVPRPEEIEKKLGPQHLGNLYHVEIMPDEHALLDWEKPLSEQSEQVQDALQRAGFDIKTMNKIKLNSNRNFAVGADVYRLLQHEHGAGDESAELASKALHEAGIPGIKYLDQGSRDLNTSHGGVMFNGENLTGSEDLPKTQWAKLKALNLGNNEEQTIAVDSALNLLHKYGNVQDTIKALKDADFSQYKETNPSLFYNAQKENEMTREWIENNAGKISFAEPKKPTSNYVIFHPSNLKIVGRNGVEWQPEPLDHNPFTHKAEFVDYNPFVRKP